MMELTINGTVYEFNFGMGFLREINKRVQTPVDGLKGVDKNIGLQFTVASIIDGDVEALVDALDIANKGMSPRLTRQALDAYIDDADTDIDGLFTMVIDFLSKANAVKKTVASLQEAIKEASK